MSSTYYNLLVFALAVLIITVMVIFGEMVNREKLTHEFYIEKISEEK